MLPSFWQILHSGSWMKKFPAAWQSRWNEMEHSLKMFVTFNGRSQQENTHEPAFQAMLPMSLRRFDFFKDFESWLGIFRNGCTMLQSPNENWKLQSPPISHSVFEVDKASYAKKIWSWNVCVKNWNWRRSNHKIRKNCIRNWRCLRRDWRSRGAGSWLGWHMMACVCVCVERRFEAERSSRLYGWLNWKTR